MKNLIDLIEELPGLKKLSFNPSAWISREAVLELVSDYSATHLGGMIELRGCTRKEVEDCLRKLRAEEKSSLLDKLTITVHPDTESFQVETYINGDDHTVDHTVWPASADKVLARVRAFLECVLGFDRKLEEGPFSGLESRSLPQAETRAKPKITIHIEYPSGFSFRDAQEVQKALEDAIRNISIWCCE